jgi:hypothetical protein
MIQAARRKTRQRSGMECKGGSKPRGLPERRKRTAMPVRDRYGDVVRCMAGFKALARTSVCLFSDMNLEKKQASFQDHKKTIFTNKYIKYSMYPLPYSPVPHGKKFQIEAIPTLFASSPCLHRPHLPSLLPPPGSSTILPPPWVLPPHAPLPSWVLHQLLLALLHPSLSCTTLNANLPPPAPFPLLHNSC